MKKEENYLRNWLTRFRNTDQFLLQVTLALIIIGLIFAFSSSAFESYKLTKYFWTLGCKQFIALIFGLVFLIFFWILDYKFWYKSTWLLAWSMLIIMLITIYSGAGKEMGGAKRWLDIGLLQLQPAEITKFAIILLLSKFLTKHHWNEFKSYYYLIFSILLIFVVYKQPDLGSASILFLVVMQMLFVFGWPIWFLILLCSISGYASIQKIAETKYQLARIISWINPSGDPQGAGYNLIQAKYAIGFGSLFGVGLGNSIQKHGYLPVAHADFIFAVIAEEIGLFGVTAILLLYITWILRALHLVNKVKNKYGRILGSGIIFIISTQAVVNILVAVGLLPVTGVTLPFFSCGGTSLFVTLAMCGVLFNITSTAKE